MALRWIEGFENIGPTNITSGALQDALAAKWDTTFLWPLCELTTGRNGYGTSFQFSPRLDRYLEQIFDSQDTWIVGFGCRGAVVFPADQYILDLKGADNPQVRLKRIASGELQAWTGGTLVGTTVGAGLAESQWSYIQVKTYIHDTAGTIEIRVDDAVVLTLSGIDTDTYGVGTVSKIRFWADSDARLDDIYICDSTGASHNDFLGQCRVVGLQLDGDGMLSQWEASGAASHYTYLNETPIDGDAGYIQAQVSGDADMFSTTLVNPSFDVLGLQFNAATRTLSAQRWDLHYRIDSNGTIENLSSGHTYSAFRDYHTNFGISVVDPDTGVAWTPAGINNATFGVKAV